MSYTADDLVAIERLIAGGVDRVRFSDGREVQNMPARDLMAIHAEIATSLTKQSANKTVRRIKIYSTKDF